MLEKTMRKEMITKMDKNKILLQPIESPATGTGILDIFYRTNNADGWIELKVIDKCPVRKGIVKIPWRPGQMNWITRYLKLNGNVFLFLHIEKALWVFKDFHIQKEYSQSEIVKLSSYRDYWKEIDWDHIYNMLDINISDRY